MTFSAAVRRFGRFCCALVLVQLAVAAVMRHSFAGLAIPSFPWSTPQGNLLPAVWSFPVGIHFAHRVMALILTLALPAFAIVIWRQPGATAGLRQLAVTLVALLGLQILLGIEILHTLRDPYITTAHVLVGALTLATTFLLTFLVHRSAMEDSASSSGRDPDQTAERVPARSNAGSA